jgi:hypothetical protein
VNYVQVTGAATGLSPVISAQGSDANIQLQLQSKGTGLLRFATGSGLQAYVSDVASPVNQLVFSGAATGNAVRLSALGSDTNIDLALTTKGTGALRVNTGGGEQFRVTDTASANIYWVATGGVGGSGRATFTTAGNTTATSMQIVNHTAAPVILLTGNTEQLRVSHTASAVNFVQVTGAATGNSPIISAQGSDANAGIWYYSKGFGGHRFYGYNGSNIFGQFYAAQANPVNYLQIGASSSGNALPIQAVGSDTNIDLALTTKGTGAVRVNTGGGEQFRVTDTASANIYWAATGGVGGSGRATLTTAGNTTATSMQIANHTAASVILLTGNTEQLRVSHTASAVNFVQVTGSATGSGPTISSQGSDTNAALTLTSKGSGDLRLSGGTSGWIDFRPGGVRSAQVEYVASAVNYLNLRPAVASSSPVIAAQGSDTNIDLTLTPKGTGNVRFGTFTADMTLIVQGYIEVKDSGGTIRKLAVIA